MMARQHQCKDVDSLRATIAGLLDEMADAAGDKRFRSAAAMVRGNPAGRQRKDDAQALEYAEALLAMGAASSPHRACAMTAEVFAPSEQVEAMRDRIRKKLRTKLNTSEQRG